LAKPRPAATSPLSCLAAPANRIGSAVLQEVITLTVFAAFSVTCLGERVTLNHLVGLR